MWVAVSQIIATLDPRLGDHSVQQDVAHSDAVSDFSSIFGEADQADSEAEGLLEETDAKLALELTPVSPDESGDVAEDAIPVPLPRLPNETRVDPGQIRNGTREAMAPRVPSKALDPVLESASIDKDQPLPGISPEVVSFGLTGDGERTTLPNVEATARKTELFGKVSGQHRQNSEEAQKPYLDNPAKAVQAIEKSIDTGGPDFPIDQSKLASIPQREEVVAPKLTGEDKKLPVQHGQSLSEISWRPRERMADAVEKRPRERIENRPSTGVIRQEIQGDALSRATSALAARLPDRSGEAVQNTSVPDNPIGGLRQSTEIKAPFDVPRYGDGRPSVPHEATVVTDKPMNSRGQWTDQRQPPGSVDPTDVATVSGFERGNLGARAREMDGEQVLPRRRSAVEAPELISPTSRHTAIDEPSEMQRIAFDAQASKGDVADPQHPLSILARETTSLRVSEEPVLPRMDLTKTEKRVSFSNAPERHSVGQNTSRELPAVPVVEDSLQLKVVGRGGEPTYRPSKNLDDLIGRQNARDQRPDAGLRSMDGAISPTESTPKLASRSRGQVEQSVPKPQNSLVPTPAPAEETVNAALPAKPDMPSGSQSISMDKNWVAGFERGSNPSNIPLGRSLLGVRKSDATQNSNRDYVSVSIQQNASSIFSQGLAKEASPDASSQEHRSIIASTYSRRDEREVASAPVVAGGQQSPTGYAASVPTLATSDFGERQKSVEGAEWSTASVGAFSEENGRVEPRSQVPSPLARDLNAPVVRAIADPLVAALRSGNGIAGNEIEVELSPAELGRVRIGFTSTESGLLVTLFADRPETTDIIRRHVSLLTEDLRGMGFDKLSVDVQSGGTGSKQPQHEFGTSPRLSRTPEAFEETAQTEANATSSPTALDSALDLRL